MPTFGTKSKSYLVQCHPALQKVLKEAIKNVDFSIICATRGRAAQEEAFRNGFTKVHFPNSAHNQTPSVAIDFLPYPFRGWGVTSDFKRVGKAIIAAGKRVDIDIRWGGDFNMDGDKTTSDAWDAGHVEIHPWRDWAKR
jgi:peptidoglycan L-alanyl-D-glutamate endopeptidase CwlK